MTILEQILDIIVTEVNNTNTVDENRCRRNRSYISNSHRTLTTIDNTAQEEYQTLLQVTRAQLIENVSGFSVERTILEEICRIIRDPIILEESNRDPRILEESNAPDNHLPRNNVNDVERQQPESNSSDTELPPPSYSSVVDGRLTIGGERGQYEIHTVPSDPSTVIP